MTEPVVALPCMCGSFRRVSRALSQLYDEALRTTGLRGTQFTLLQVLSRAGELSQGQLGDVLAIDSTTLSRTLRPLVRKRWIEERPGSDRRERLLRLSGAGQKELERVEPYWERVQQRLRKVIGAKSWENFLELSNQLTSAALQLAQEGKEE